MQHTTEQENHYKLEMCTEAVCSYCFELGWSGLCVCYITIQIPKSFHYSGPQADMYQQIEANLITFVFRSNLENTVYIIFGEVTVERLELIIKVLIQYSVIILTFRG